MSYKKWVYKYKYLKTEESEFAEKMQKYIIKFYEDFIINNPPPQKKAKNPPIQDFNTTSSKEIDLETLESKPK